MTRIHQPQLKDSKMIKVELKILPFNKAIINLPKETGENLIKREDQIETTSPICSEPTAEFIQSENVYQEI